MDMIKDTDYIVTLAPMKSKLKLRGHALDLFALIYGYSRDGESTCRASLSYMAEWLDTDKSAVSKLIKRLADAGYINKIEYLKGDMKCYEYTSNYGVMLARAEAGMEMGLPTPKRVVKNTTVVKMTTKGCQNDNERVVKMTTNNTKDNIIYSSFRARGAQEQEEEKKSFYEIFFFRNAADPAGEVDRFVAYNTSREWRNDSGREYDSVEKRRSLAELWEFKGGQGRCSDDFLDAVRCLHGEARARGIEDCDALLDQKMTFRFDGHETCWKLTLCGRARRWIEDNVELAREHIMPLAKGWKVKYVNA